METRNLPLRILYTVSGSQYILARSSSLVPVVLVPPLHTANHYDQSLANQPPVASTSKVEPRPEFGTASLKTCLDAICTSSPELVQDKRRDFSVYVLDPLESNSAPARVNISNAISPSHPSDQTSTSNEQSRGLAVALGLMSWALMPDERESVPVTGTVIKLPTGQEALEVIFALKETVAMEKASLPAALRTWGLPPEPSTKSRVSASRPYLSQLSTGGVHKDASNSIPTSCPGQVPTDDATLATIASIQMRSQLQQKRVKAKEKKLPRPPSIDPQNSEADRLFLTQYIGPERKKAGRPPNPAASGSRSNKGAARTGSGASSIDNREGTNVPNSTNPALCVQRTTIKPPQEPPSQPFISTPLVRSQRDPEPQSLLDILTILSSSSSSSDSTLQNTALLAALGAIDSGSGEPDGSPDKQPGPMLVNALRDLISAVAHQKTPLSDPHTSHPSARSHQPDDDIVLLDKENVNPTVFRRRGERSGKTPDTDDSTPNPTVSTITSGLPNTETPAIRGLTTRTNRSVDIAPAAPAHLPASSNNPVRRKRTLSDIMDEREANRDKGTAREREWVERRDAHRYAHSSPKKNENCANRHYPRLASEKAQPLRRPSGSYYRTGMEPWTSPPRPSVGNLKLDENTYQRPITVEDSPGPSKVSASSPARPTVIKPRRPYVVPAWARTSTSTQPRLSEEAIRAQELAEERRKDEAQARKKDAKKERKKRQLAKSSSPPRQQTINRPKPTTALTQSQDPPPLTVAGDLPVFAMTSAIQDRIAAFSTPLFSEPKSPRSSNKPAPPSTPPSKGDSDLFSPCEDGSLFTPIHGPGICNTKTPIAVGSVGRKRRTPSLNTPKIAAEDGNEASGEDNDDDFEETLNRELEGTLDDIDTPSNTLPAISSDVEMENEIPSLDQAALRTKQTEDTEQHWVGLPPSSPPPPTSPLIMPQDDESDDTMLPAVTSDADPPTDSEIYSDSFYTTEPSICTDEEIADYLQNDFASIFGNTADQQPVFASETTQANMDLFDQFTNHNTRSDSAEPNDASFNILQNGITDFDLTEFWETFKPLLQDQNGGGTIDSMNMTSEKSTESQNFDHMSFDHVKLAEDVQALFSGCVM